MLEHARRHVLPALLVLGLALVTTSSAQAQDRHDRDMAGATRSMDVQFKTSPHWVGIPGTKVREIRASDRPDYDIFLYGGRYYIFRDGQWYMSRKPRGRFLAIDVRLVPAEFSRVPRGHWHNYPSAWVDEHQQGRGHGRDKGNH